MKVIKISRDGSVTSHEGEPNYWRDRSITWAITGFPGHPDHDIYYDDESMSDPGQVRVMIGNIELPLPAWVVGVDGEKTGPATLTIKQVESTISLPA